MNRKLPIFSLEFISFVENFAKSHGLDIDRRPTVIALSGGIDSVSLLKVMSLLFERGKIAFKPRVIFIDHQTRSHIEREKEAMIRYCHSLDIDISISKVSFEHSRNFEKNARDARYKLFKSELKNNELLLLGHHLGDSLEWSLMQTLKSSSLKSSLGIPVINGVIRRPFLCVSKNHIIRFAKEMGLKWFEDPTNSDVNFERNLIRKHLKELEKTYPKLYAHHATRSASLAKKFGLHVKERSNKKAIKGPYLSREWGYIYIHDENDNSFSFDQRCEDCLQLIFKGSKSSRGKIRQQYQKLKDLIRDYKVAELNFSGGVRFLHFQEISLILRAQENIKLYSKASHIPEPVPFYVHVKRKNGLKNPSFLACSEHDGDLNYFYRYPDAQVKYWV